MNEASVKTYDIDGKTYEMPPLVFGQWQQLNKIMAQVEMPAELSPRNIVAAIGTKLDQVLAVILTEQGKKPQDKDLVVEAEHLAFSMEPEQVAEVITDFFAAAPVASVLNLVTGVTEAIQQRVRSVIGSSNASSSSVTETGASETASSGDAPQKTLAPG